MKVFFTASQRGKKDFGAYYKSIASQIQSLGYGLLEDDLLTMNSDEFYKAIASQEAESSKFYKQEIKNLQDAEINVFECSFHSLSIGFIIEKSLELSKPTVILYHEKNKPHFLMSIDEEKLIVKSYNEKNLPKIVQECLAEAKQQRDKRFNFFISPRLLAYLEKASSDSGVTKSRFIRDLILDHKKKHTAS